jgi:hypothetical protein
MQELVEIAAVTTDASTAVLATDTPVLFGTKSTLYSEARAASSVTEPLTSAASTTTTASAIVAETVSAGAASTTLVAVEGSSAAPSEAALPIINIEGFLKKKPRSTASTGRNWMPRLFSLNYGVLSWFKVKGEMSISLDDIAMVKEGQDELVVLQKDTVGYLFTVSYKNSQLPVESFACSSRGEVVSWVACLTEMLAVEERDTTRKLTSKSSVVFRKKGRKWLETSASIRDSAFVFQRRKPCGDYDLHDFAVVEIDPEDATIFHVNGLQSSADLSLSCEDTETCKLWVSHIRASIEYEASTAHAATCDKSERE